MALRPCKECGKEISNKAEKCPHCGAKTRTTVSLFTAIVVIFFLFVLIGTLIDSPSGNTGSDASGPKDESGGAAYACQKFMKDRLKAPATADFPWSFDHTRSGADQDEYTITSYVDAQNSFGAQLRTHYTCTVKADGDVFRLVNLKTSEK